MRKLFTSRLSMISCSVVLFFAVLGNVWEGLPPSVSIDQRLERACHRAVKAMSPLDYRDIKTVKYNQREQRLGVVEGQMMSRYQGQGWANIGWTCHIHPRSGRVISTEFRQS